MILTINDLVKKYCPRAKTVEEMYTGNEATIEQICVELNCVRTDYLISIDDIKILTEHSNKSKEFKQAFEEFLSQINTNKYK